MKPGALSAKRTADSLYGMHPLENELGDDESIAFTGVARTVTAGTVTDLRLHPVNTQAVLCCVVLCVGRGTPTRTFTWG